MAVYEPPNFMKLYEEAKAENQRLARACAAAQETLRDRFAMAALPGLLMSGRYDFSGVAEDSYRYADAMMKAREEKR